MTVFKTFFKILNKCKVTIIIYTVILIGFGGFNMQTSETNTHFIESKPDILIINQDQEKGVTQNLIKYIESNSNIIDIENDEQAISDALFYRDINYIIYIPENYRENFLNGENPEIQIKSTGDYQAAFAEMMLERYIKVANTYQHDINNEDELIKIINETLSKQTNIEITSKLDTNNLAKASFYYNFASYSILAACIYIICLILSSFREEKIRKRTVISSMNYKKYNRQLLMSNSLFALVLWILYVALSFILLGDIMFTEYGLVYIINSFVLTICALTIAFLIGNLVSNKDAISGIVNVVSIGSSFLCGVFVPMEMLPDSVLKIAHILPTYYYVSNNEMIAKLEVFNFETLKPILTNMGTVLGFSILFIILTNIISKKKRKIG